MPASSKFSAPRSRVAPSGAAAPTVTTQNLLGLDLTSPYDLIKTGRSPYAKNFRLYTEGADDRRVSASTRKGSGRYVSPLFGTVAAQNVITTGLLDKPIGVILNWQAMPFTNTVAGRLGKVELSLKTGTGIGPLLVDIYDDKNGFPGTKIAESSIVSGITGVYSYQSARFIEAPLLTAGTQYWIITHVQDNGRDGYQWASNSGSTLARISNSGVSGLTTTNYSLNFKTYIVPDYKAKGSTRFNQQNNVNTTVVAYQDTMYAINDGTGAATPLVSGLNNLATNYYFSFGDGKVFWVNGYDNLMAWDGTYTANNTNIVTNGTFESNSAPWLYAGAATGGVTSQDNTKSHSGTASLLVSATGTGTRAANYPSTFTKGRIYNLSFWAMATAGTIITATIGSKSITATATGSWQQVTGALKTTEDNSILQFSAPANFNVDDVSLVYTGVEQILNTNLPILSLFTFHKDRAWGIVAGDPNKLVFSENPGNPSTDAAQWYYAWLSVSFIYVPVPKSNDPITALVPFQDVLKIFTTNNKYDLSGTDRSSLFLRQSTGSKGAVNQNSVVADENFIYFASSDGFYQHNGSVDIIISDSATADGGSIQPEFDKIEFKRNITGVKWQRQIRWYYGYGPYNTDCALYHTVYKEWQHDTEVYVDRAVFFSDADDDGRLAEFSSLVPAIYNAEQDYNSLGKPIDFEYDMKAESMGAPAQLKRILKFFPIIQGPANGFTVNVDMNADFANSDLKNQVILTTQGAVWGDFVWGDGTLWGGDKTFRPTKLRYPGYAYYWQPKIYRKGVNTPVYFFGVQYSYKAKRL